VAIVVVAIGEGLLTVGQARAVFDRGAIAQRRRGAVGRVVVVDFVQLAGHFAIDGFVVRLDFDFFLLLLGAFPFPLVVFAPLLVWKD
jgi:hypothetical protein